MMPVPDFDLMPQFAPDGNSGLTNFDHSIEPGCDESLRSGSWTEYSGWNFWGCVWFAGGEFHCQVWQYGSPREVVSAASLRTLMEEVCGKYGTD